MRAIVFIALFVSSLFLAAQPSLAIDLKPISVFANDRMTQPKVLIDTLRLSWRSFSFESHLRGFNGHDLGYLWNFGDGHTSDQAKPLHIFLRPGNYPVTLVVTDLLSGRTFESQIAGVGISFFNFGNTKLWFLVTGIILFGALVVRLCFFLAFKKIKKFEQRNKRSEHPILIRKKKNPPMTGRARSSARF